MRYGPTLLYVCEADVPLTTVPSPKSITDLATLPDDPDVDAVYVSPPLCDTSSETDGGWSPGRNAMAGDILFWMLGRPTAFTNTKYVVDAERFALLRSTAWVP